MTMLLEVDGLKKYFPIKKGLMSRTVGHVQAVDGVSFSVKAGEVLGLQAGRYRAYDATLNVDGVPIAYLPYMAGDFREEQSAPRST